MTDLDQRRHTPTEQLIERERRAIADRAARADERRESPQGWWFE